MIVWLLLCSFSLFSQNAVADLHFESAEKAYNIGNYKEALAKLDQTEKLTGPMSKTLYLRIAAQDKLLKQSGLYADEESFELLTDLRDNAKIYLEAMADQGLDDRYREVFAISEQLTKHPQTKSDWVAGRRDKLEADRQRELEREMAVKRAEEQRVAAEFESIRAERKSVYESTVFEAAEVLDHETDNSITVYVIRPQKEEDNSITQALFVNEEVEVPKLNPGQHVILHCTPGLLRIGVLDDEDFVKRRKRRRNRGILVGGVVGFAAASVIVGKVASRNADPFLLQMDGAQRVYYIRTAVDNKKSGGGINYWEIAEAEAKKLLEQSERKEKN